MKDDGFSAEKFVFVAQDEDGYLSHWKIKDLGNDYRWEEKTK